MIRKTGFTLVEVLLVVAIFGILAGIGFLNIRLVWTANQLQGSTTETIRALKEAQNNAMDGILDSQWGVFFDINNNQFTLFKGPDYSGRDPAHDLATALPKLIKITNINLNGGGTEIVFEKTSGKTNHYGSLTMEGFNSQTKTLILNQYGVIETY